jgi:hypothetical protein
MIIEHIGIFYLKNSVDRYFFFAIIIFVVGTVPISAVLNLSESAKVNLTFAVSLSCAKNGSTFPATPGICSGGHRYVEL